MSTSMTIEGIVYAASQDASTDVNTLDDYQEGTWTPIFNYQNGGQESSKAFTLQLGTYTMISRAVFAHVSIQGTFTYSYADNVTMSTPLVAAAPAQVSAGMKATGTSIGVAFSTSVNGTAFGSFASSQGQGNWSQYLATTFHVIGSLQYTM